MSDLKKADSILSKISSISSDLTNDEIMSQIVELVQTYFNLCFVGLFLVEHNHRLIVFKAGSGTIGQRLASSEWKLPLDGMHPWGNAVRLNEIRLNNWQTQEARGCPLPPNIESDFTLNLQPRNEFFFSPLIPNMVWQLLLPFRHEGKIIGVLDFVSDDLGKDFNLQTIQEALFVANRIASKFRE